MLKNILSFIILIFAFSLNIYANWEENNEIQATVFSDSQDDNEIESQEQIFDFAFYKKESYIEDSYKIAIEDFVVDNENFNLEDYEISFRFSWKEFKNKDFELNFDTTWVKNITFEIYEKWDELTLVTNWALEIFVYNKVIPAIISSSIDSVIVENYINSYKPNWVLVYVLWNINSKDLPIFNISWEYKKIAWKDSPIADYIMLWWGRDFSFDIITKLNREVKLWLFDFLKKDINIYLLSSFNIDVINSYLNTFLSQNSYISNIIIVADQARFKVPSDPLSIESVALALASWSYEFETLWKDTNMIPDYRFIAKFVNIFSQKWFDTTSIYIIILMPFILTILAFVKHFVWFSTVWIVIPTMLIILFLEVWVVFSLFFFAFFLVLNILIANFASRLNLLYTPKISLITTLNLLALIFWIIFIDKISYINITFDDTIYLVLFVIIAERLTSLIMSKEFWEYKSAIINTVVITLICYFIFDYWALKIYLLAYPEFMLLLLPLNYLLWRFTGLRITEYFRFKEVIKSIEE